MQVKELESELRQVQQHLLAARAESEKLSVELTAAKREASDSQVLIVSLKSMAKGDTNALSSAAENAALKQELFRCQDANKRLMDEGATNAQALSSLEHELEAKMDQIDELKGQIMSSLLKNRELALEGESSQNDLRDKEQELRSMQNYIASLQSEGGGGDGEGLLNIAREAGVVGSASSEDGGAGGGVGLISVAIGSGGAVGDLGAVDEELDAGDGAAGGGRDKG
jgi:chromosome segregation ATPase